MVVFLVRDNVSILRQIIAMTRGGLDRIWKCLGEKSINLVPKKKDNRIDTKYLTTSK